MKAHEFVVKVLIKSDDGFTIMNHITSTPEHLDHKFVSFRDVEVQDVRELEHDYSDWFQEGEKKC